MGFVSLKRLILKDKKLKHRCLKCVVISNLMNFLNSIGVMLGLCFLPASLDASPDFFELPPIKYSETASEDAVAELIRSDWSPSPRDSKAFLKSLLYKLGVSKESQVLVFSKTSLQTGLITQKNQRAIYFSPDVYIGWVPGGKIEIIIEDAKLGPVFYVVSPPLAGQKPKFVRATDSCLVCHATSRTENIPGMFIRSVIPDENAHARLGEGTTLVTDATPLKERWGGWYVTGRSDDPHLGNRWSVDESPLEPEHSSLDDLRGQFDTEKYLTSRSDILALMVLEHQCKVHNLLTKAKFGFRRAEHFQKSINPNQKIGAEGSMTRKSAEQSAKEIVSALLFENETRLGGDGVESDERFRKILRTFAPETKAGNSLADLRLFQRIFRHKCSYMVYSKAFKSLPDPVKEQVLQHLREKTAGLKERKVRAILDETLPGF